MLQDLSKSKESLFQHPLHNRKGGDLHWNETWAIIISKSHLALSNTDTDSKLTFAGSSI